MRILKYFHDGPLNVLKGVSLTLLGSRHIECRDSLLESIWPQLSSIFSLRFSCRHRRRCLFVSFLLDLVARGCSSLFLRCQPSCFSSPTFRGEGRRLIFLLLPLPLSLFLLSVFSSSSSRSSSSASSLTPARVFVRNTISIRRRILIIASKRN